jgi:hypothetical protein
MNIVKSIVIIFTIGLFFLSAIYGQTEQDFEIQGNDDGTVTILRYKGSERNITIPATILNSAVSKIYDKAFYNKLLTEVTIPEGVTHIGIDAFKNNKLGSIIIPDSVVYIGNGAFSLNKLTSISLPNSIKYIGANAFSNNQLQSIEIPDSVLVIGMKSFSTNKLNDIIIPNNVIYIGVKAFETNPINKITIGNNVVHISEGAFNFITTDFNISSLTIIIGENVEISNQGENGSYTRAFPFHFEREYINNGRRKGEYVYKNGKWIRNDSP